MDTGTFAQNQEMSNTNTPCMGAGCAGASPDVSAFTNVRVNPNLPTLEEIASYNLMNPYQKERQRQQLQNAGLRRRKPERYVAPVNKHLAKCEWHTGDTNTEQRRCAERRDRRFPCADYVHDTAAVDPCGKPSIYEWFFAHPGGASCAGGFFGRDQQHCYTLRDSLGRWGKFYPHQRDGNG